MADGLGVGYPQAFFLQNSISAMTASQPTVIEGAHAKRPVPTRYGSVFFQKPLLNDSGLFR